MADKSIDQLNAAEKIYATDLFVLQQSGSAKKLTGQVLENWLVSFADGHGGIQSIAKLSTSGLVDTYRITLADTTTFDFVITNGRSITGISKTGTNGLVDTYTIEYNDGTTSTFIVNNGAKGDKGDNAYVWIKYASQEPTESSHSIGDIPDNWIGIYSGKSSTAPTDWKQYKWFKTKGEKGNTGDAATLVTKSVTYQVSDSGTIIPSGAWVTDIPVVAQGKFLWTKTELQFNTGDPIVSYSVARMGMDGSGSVSSVNNVSPDETGNVTLAASDVGALPSAGGDMTGAINMNGQPISGLNDPTEGTQAARKGYVDSAVRKAAPVNLLDNSDFRNPVNQRGQASYTSNGHTIDRWQIWDGQLHIGDGFISVKNVYQLLKLDTNKVYTLAAKTSTGVVCFTTKPDAGGAASLGNLQISMSVLNSLVQVLFTNAPGNQLGVVVWAAMYEGEYTAETLPEYRPKGYGAELAECQRYYREFESAAITKIIDATFVVGKIVNMRDMGAYLPTVIPKKFTKPNVIDVTAFDAADIIQIEKLDYGTYHIMRADLHSCMEYDVGVLQFSVSADL